MIRSTVRNPFHLLLCLLLIAVVAQVLLRCCEAHGAQPVCRTCNVARAVVAPQYAYQQQVVVATPAYYQVGAQLQGEATAEYAFRQSPGFQELQRLRGYREGVEAVTQPQQVAPPAEVPTTEAPPTPERLQVTPEQPQPPAPTPATADQTSIINARCIKCHSGPKPKGGLQMDGSVQLTPDDAVAMAQAVRAGKMPKDGALSNDHRLAFYDELFTPPAPQ